MKKLLLILFVLLSQQTFSSEKTNVIYPPYPNIWGLVMPTKPLDRYLSTEYFKKKNGDILIQYRVYGTDLYKQYSLFSSSVKTVDEDVARNFSYDFSKNRLKYGAPKLILIDKSEIDTLGGANSRGCYTPLQKWLRKKDSQNKTTKGVVVIYIHDEQKKHSVSNQYCEGGKWDAHSRLSSTSLSLHSLSDGTFLAYERNRNVVIRFRKDLTTLFSHPNIAVVDKKIVDEVLKKSFKKYMSTEKAMKNYLSEIEAIVEDLKGNKK